MKEVLLKDYISVIESGTRGKGGATAVGVPSLGAEHLNSDGTINWDKNKMKYIPVELFENLKSGIVHNNDVLIVKDGATTGKVAYIEKMPYPDAAINEHVFLLRPKSEILPKYLFYYLTSVDGNKKIMSNFRGATVGGISKSFIEMPINIISIDVQQQVVNVLDKISHIITLRKKQLKIFDELVKSRFIEMFGSRKCELLRLKDFCGFRQGTQVPIEKQINKKLTGYVRFLRIIDYTQAPQEPRFILSGAREVDEKSIVVVRYGASAGFVGRGYKGVLANNLFEVIPNEIIMSKDFLYYAMKYGNFENTIHDKAFGAAMPAISFTMMNDIYIAKPDVKRQEIFCKTVNEINKSKLEIQKSLDKLEILKKSLMQQYFG